ncbi:MAG: hypothetical protein WAP23_01085 [Candidatus Spechtbacterales bacterium]
MALQLNKTTILSIVALVFAAVVVYAAQTNAASFGFEKNAKHRKSADAESVAGCMQSCQDMLLGWQEMNPSSPNYVRQHEKIAAKAEQCLAMNALAGSPYSDAEILASCGLATEGPRCVEVSAEDLHSGACGDLSFIKEANLPQCCALEGGPSGDLLCGANAEWTVGVAAFPVCYVPNS